MNTKPSYQQQKFPITNIGSVTLLMIFIVLCMVTFAALSLSSASYDWRSAQKSADHTAAYYQASNQAEEALAQIDQILIQCRTTAADSTAYYQQVASACANLTDPNVSFTEGSADSNTSEASETGTVSASFISWQISISDSQALQVRLELLNPYENAPGNAADSANVTGSGSIGSGDSTASVGAVDSLYRITSWQVVSTKEWNGDNSLKLLQP